MVLRTPSSHSLATLFWKHFLKVWCPDRRLWPTEGNKEFNLLIPNIFYTGSIVGQLFHVCIHITPLTHRAHFSLQPWSFLRALQCVQYMSNMVPFRCLEDWFSLFWRVAQVGRACLILSYFFSSSLQPNFCRILILWFIVFTSSLMPPHTWLPWLTYSYTSSPKILRNISAQHKAHVP